MLIRRNAGPLTQPDINQAFEKQRPWGPENKMTKGGTKVIAEMIAIDMEPFSVVEHTEFRRVLQFFAPQFLVPSRKHFLETEIPNMYRRVKLALRSVVGSEPSLTFRVDNWTAPQTTKSYMGLTCHWLTDEFDSKMAILHCKPITGRHTAETLGTSFCAMLQSFGIEQESCRLVISDSAANMKKAFADLGVPLQSCYAHSLQLVVNTGLPSQRAVIDACAVARRIVTHFKHSTPEVESLHELQAELKMPCHKLIQDVTTHWYSTHDMLTWFLEQKRSITLYMSESEMSSNLTLPTKHQWLLVEKVVLDQFAVMTKIISSASTHISYVILSLAALICFLETYGLPGSANSAENMAGIRTMRSELVKALVKRFQTGPTDDLHRKPAYVRPITTVFYC